MKRNRIVINLDKLRSVARKKPPGGFARVLIIIAVVLLLLAGGILGGGYLWWRRYQSTPAYSLAVLADASQRKDNATVDSILDIDKVTDDFVAQARQRSTGASSLIPSDWSAKADSALLSVTPKLKQTVHDEIVKELQRLTEPAAGKPFILIALAITGFADIKEENNVAQAMVNIKGEQLRLTMQAEAGRWRITAVQNDKLAKLIADGVMRNVPSPGGVQDELGKQMDKLKKQVK